MRRRGLLLTSQPCPADAQPRHAERGSSAAGHSSPACSLAGRGRGGVAGPGRRDRHKTLSRRSRPERVSCLWMPRRDRAASLRPLRPKERPCRRAGPGLRHDAARRRAGGGRRASRARAKVEIAGLLAAMGVDVIEAGFPVSSPGEHEAVRGVARERARARVCGLARARPDGDRRQLARRCATPRRRASTCSCRAPRSTSPTSCGATRDEVVEMARGAGGARARATRDDVEFSPMDATRSEPELRRRAGARGDRGGREHDQPARHRRVCPAGAGRARCSAGCTRACPSSRTWSRLVPRPGRSGPRDGELARRDRRRRAPGGARGERARRARGQHAPSRRW